MGWLPQAIRRDVGAPARFSNGRMRSYTGVVLHVNAANSRDLYGWITGNNGMSCHWQVLKDGTIYQYIDTAYSSWCQAAGNDDYLSIETSGFPNEPLTDAQVKACAAIMAFVHREHGIPLTVADKPGQRGLGWHGMGGAAWGNHPGCPGDLRKAQRAKILQIASATTPTPAPKPTPTPATPNTTPPVKLPTVPAWPLPAGHYFGLITGPAQSHGGYYASERPHVKRIQERLQALGYAPRTTGWADGVFEQPTADAVTRWQRAKHPKQTTRYGEVWSDDWKRLFS